MKLGKLTARVLICVSISLLLCCDLIVCTSVTFAQQRGPLSVADVETLLKAGNSDALIAKRIQQYGVNFETTAAVRTRLQSAGAGAEVMGAVEKASAEYVAKRSAIQLSKTSEAERARLEEENRKLREALQQAEAKKKEAAKRADVEGENRKLREALKKTDALKSVSALSPPQTGGDGAEMVSVPAGEFWMGSNDRDIDEKPRRRVYLDGFRIDKYEVTTALYRRFIESAGREAPRSWKDSKWNEPRQPVVGVSWDDADSYCRWAKKRLPTEAEWEKAARGTDGRKFPWGEQWDATRANSAESEIGKTTPIGNYSRGESPYGAHDMAGNVWEWVADWYDESYYRRAPDRNPKGPDSGLYRVLRGGAWNRDPGTMRTSNRGRNLPTTRVYAIGFRCAQ